MCEDLKDGSETDQTLPNLGDASILEKSEVWGWKLFGQKENFSKLGKPSCRWGYNGQSVDQASQSFLFLCVCVKAAANYQLGLGRLAG